MNIQDTELKLKEYINMQLSALSRTNPQIGFIKPLVTRALDKKIGQMKGLLDLISDESGNIDVPGILTEMIASVTESQPFVMEIPMLGNVEIGGGSIKVAVPFINKKVVINSADLISFKNFMIK